MTPEALAELHARCFDAAPRPWSAAEFADLLAMPGVGLLTAGGGFALFRIAGPEAELMTLAVDPDHRRKGVGSSLVTALLSKAGAAAAREVLLEVADDNLAAMKLYEKQGFEAVGYRKDYYQGPRGAKVTAVVMRKRLASCA